MITSTNHTRRAARRWLAAIGLALAVAGASARAASATAPRRGRVVEVTARRAYVDAGRKDGLAAGASLELHRGSKRAATCTVETLADHAATCTGDGVRAGDTFALVSAPADETSGSRGLPEPRPDEEVAEGRRALESSAYPIVAWTHPVGEARPLRAGVADVSAGHEAWVSFAGGGRRQIDRLDVSVRGAELPFGGLRGSLDMTALHWLERPADARFLPERGTEARVWEAAIFSHDPSVRQLAFAAGRIRPFATPGLAVLDGAQVGWMNAEGTAEAGLLGGFAPDAVTLDPSARRWLASGYLGATRLGRPASTLRLFRAEARAGVRRDPDAGLVGETEALAQLWIGRGASAAGEARLAAPVDRSKAPAFEAVRFDLAARPASTFRLGGAFRFLGPAIAGPESLGGTAEPWVGAYHADADATWEASPRLGLAAAGGFARDVETGSNRVFAGPDVTLPRFFASGGLGFGYREEIGWFAGRSGYLQAHASPAERLRFFGRLSYFQEEVAGAPIMNWRHEVGAYLDAEARLGRAVSLRAHVLGRLSASGLASEGGGGPPVGLVAGLDLLGRI